MQYEFKTTDYKKQKQAGFTLVEVMVTMVIIGILTTVVVLNVGPMIGKASVQKSKTDINTLKQAAEMYNLDMNTYPDSLEDLMSTSSKADDPRFRIGGYIQALPDDPWNNPYFYAYPGENGIVDIWTLGADGVEGGEGDNADITSWSN